MEKRILTEFLLLYREFPCLWDNRQVLYSNKEARDQAYEVLLEKYKQVQEDATILDVKKKIENMRCAYRREHKKVLISRLKSGIPEHIPQLWYYEHLVFLNEISDFSNLDTSTREKGEETMKVEYIGSEIGDNETPSKKIRVKRRKSNYGSVVPTIYLPEQHDSDDGEDDEMPSVQDDNNSHNSMHIGGSVTEAEAFGTTVGLQLKDLDPMQRLIAEKMISDVIFYARLNRLNVNANINLNE